MKKQIIKFIALSICTISIMGVNPNKAYAEWKSNNVGWQYKEGSSYATGWRNINGKYYYFNSSGYMEHDTIIDGYKLNSNGEWVEEKNKTTENSVAYNNLIEDKGKLGSSMLKGYWTRGEYEGVSLTGSIYDYSIDDEKVWGRYSYKILEDGENYCIIKIDDGECWAEGEEASHIYKYKFTSYNNGQAISLNTWGAAYNEKTGKYESDDNVFVSLDYVKLDIDKMEEYVEQMGIFRNTNNINSQEFVDAYINYANDFIEIGEKGLAIKLLKAGYGVTNSNEIKERLEEI